MDISNTSSSKDTPYDLAASQTAKIISFLDHETLMKILQGTFFETPCKATFEAYAKAMEAKEGVILPFYDLEKAVEAAAKGDIEMLSQHLKVMDMPNREGEFPLTAAAHHSQIEVIEYLMKEKCDPHVEDIEMWTGAGLLKLKGHLEPFLKLQKYGDRLRYLERGSFLRQAVEKGDINEILQLVRDQAPIGQYNALGENAFHIAARRGDPLIAKLFMQVAPHLVNSGTTDLGSTPLHIAVEFGHFRFAKHLVQGNNTSILWLDGVGRTPGTVSELTHESNGVIEDEGAHVDKEVLRWRQFRRRESDSVEEPLLRRRKREEEEIRVPATPSQESEEEISPSPVSEDEEVIPDTPNQENEGEEIPSSYPLTSDTAILNRPSQESDPPTPSIGLTQRGDHC